MKRCHTILSCNVSNVFGSYYAKSMIAVHRLSALVCKRSNNNRGYCPLGELVNSSFIDL